MALISNNRARLIQNEISKSGANEVTVKKQVTQLGWIDAIRQFFGSKVII